MHAWIRPLRTRFHPSRQASAGGADRAARGGIRKSTGALARYGRVLAWTRARSDPGDGQAGGELDADPRLQEYCAGAQAGRSRGREDSRDAGGKSAPVFPELAMVDGRPARRFPRDLAELLGTQLMLGRPWRGSGLNRSAPLIDSVDREAPVAADPERGQLVFLEHPVDRGRMHAQVGRYLLNR